MQHIHFIAIGGSIMHNLAIALQKQGYHVTGSDDEFFEPSGSQLKKHDLLPEKTGWHEERIHENVDAIILGMHAKKDNPELLKAQKLGLKCYSFPEFIFEQSRDKQRVVIAGSHGKTTITSLVIHIMKYHNKEFDYLVGSRLKGFETMVQITKEAPVIILEGDEYLSSPLDKTPKFIHYNHHLGVITGIAWDHINVFPTFDVYLEQFEKFIKNTPKAGAIIYNKDDKVLKDLINKHKKDDIALLEYTEHKHVIKHGKTFLKTEKDDVEIPLIGKHNMQNVMAAKTLCNRMGITDDMFYEAIRSFQGPDKRLQLIAENNSTRIFKDFAHAPSKLKATTEAVKKQFKDQSVIGCLELHTYSSLNKDFLKEYKNTFNDVDIPVIYYDPDTVHHKNLETLTPEAIKTAFNNQDLKVFTDKQTLEDYLRSLNYGNTVLLMMSSGNFGGIDIEELAREIIR